uniref:Uncharacterized protein n=1 Tax=Heterorhabditis bacteriophora TaxID=37862 RepID=A0A1I7X9D3_HETBA
MGTISGDVFWYYYESGKRNGAHSRDGYVQRIQLSKDIGVGDDRVKASTSAEAVVHKNCHSHHIAYRCLLVASTSQRRVVMPFLLLIHPVFMKIPHFNNIYL